MKNKKIPLTGYFLFLISILNLVSCGAIKPYYDKQFRDWEQARKPDSSRVLHTVYLIGDAGAPEADKKEPTFRILEDQIYSDRDTLYPGEIDSSTGLTVQDTIYKGGSDADETVVWLGDNIYYYGLPEIDNPTREESERRILEQVNVIKEFNGKKFFIPGNHDWSESGREGLAAVNRQEQFVEEHMKGQDIFLPSNGCPGPVEVPLADNLILIIIDSQWWLHKYEKPVGPENNCNVEGEFDFVVQLDDIVKRNQDKHIVVVQHHPLFSNGSHGGHFSLKDYIFPLTLIRPNLYIPLPILGSLYPFMRKYGISRQDIPNPKYQKLKKSELAIFGDMKNVVMAVGHDHNLQLHRFKEFHQIVSGSGCKEKYLIKGNDAIFAHHANGFAKLLYYENGEVWLEFWEPVKDSKKGKVFFRTPLYAMPPESLLESEKNLVDYRDSFIVIPAGPEHEAGAITRFFFGDHYREAWTTPITIPFLDMRTEAGGLTPLRKGGGDRSQILELMNPDSVHYTLTTINKDPNLSVPQNLRKTFSEDFMKSAITAQHPYGELIVPYLAQALNLLHTLPKLVYVPYTPLLGPFIDDFGGRIMMLEIDPDENVKRYARFGYSDNILTTRQMFEKVTNHNENVIDESMFLKSRLFDMVIGDWNRHESNWRWSEFSREEGGHFYKPIARGRQDVFFRFDGLIPYLASRPWAFRHLTNFKNHYNDIIGLNYNARHIDRRILNEMSRQDWLMVVDSIQEELSDIKIEMAVWSLPDTIISLNGEEMISILKSRRDLLKGAAEKYYEILAEEVNVTGTNEDEFFLVERMNENEVRVRVYKKENTGEEGLIYDRLFFHKETKRIYLYGLQGNDSFLITGTVKSSIPIFITGGEGKDAFIDSSAVAGLSDKTIIFDSKDEENTVISSGETNSNLSKKPWINLYDPHSFNYNYVGPRSQFGFNKDDRFFFGIGFRSETWSFRKIPFMIKQDFLINYATNISSFDFTYNSRFYSIISKYWDLNLDAKYYGPEYKRNYFGLGNTTSRFDDIEENRVEMNDLYIYPSLIHRLNYFLEFGFGPYFRRVNVLEKANEQGFNFYDGGTHLYSGGIFEAEINLLEDPKDPDRGLKWYGKYKYTKDLTGNNIAFSNIYSEFSFFITPNFPFDLTLALRFGGATNIGKFAFYQANYLSGTENVRGLRRDRFGGKSMIFQNTSLRLQLFTFRSTVIKGNGGILGFVDHGKVFMPEESDNTIHRGYGPGGWVNFFDLFLLSGSYAFSEEGRFINVNFGFFF